MEGRVGDVIRVALGAYVEVGDGLYAVPSRGPGNGRPFRAYA